MPSPSGASGGFARGNRGSGRIGALVLLLFLPLAGGLVYAHARLSPQPLWTIRSVEVRGNRSISTPELLDRLRVRPGLPLWKIWGNRAAGIRSEEPRLRSLTLSWRWPRDLLVQVRERESILRVLGKPGMELSADGVLLSPLPALDPADLPLLTGSLQADLRAGRALEFPVVGPAWREILDLRETSPDLWKNISEIHYAGGSDFRIILRQGRRMVLWQPGINQELKERIPAILADLSRENVDDAVLDLRFREQLVVRRPESALADTVAPGKEDGGAGLAPGQPSAGQKASSRRRGA